MRLTYCPTHAVGRRTTPGWAFRLLCLPALLLAAACTDTPSPTEPRTPGDLGPLMSYYPDAGVLTSSRDTCPWYYEEPELADEFWESTDAELVSNPDSVFAADSAAVSDSLYWRELMLLDSNTGAELFAGRCEVEWNRCNARCRRLPRITRAHRYARALCWSGCTARYALCKRREREREQDQNACGPAPYQLIYDGEDEDCDPYSGAGGGGGGGSGGSGCQVEWVVIEVNYGSGWETYWEGYATVCG